jgi:hypothetical protein
MNLGNIRVITPPDKLFNMNISYLLVSPSMHVKQQLQTILSKCIDDLNVFIYESDDTDIDWLLSVALLSDVIILDIDHCNSMTKSFISYLLPRPNVHYITNDELTPYNLLSSNRIHNLDWIAENLVSLDDLDEDYEDDDDDLP